LEDIGMAALSARASIRRALLLCAAASAASVGVSGGVVLRDARAAEIRPAQRLAAAEPASVSATGDTIAAVPMPRPRPAAAAARPATEPVPVARTASLVPLSIPLPRARPAAAAAPVPVPVPVPAESSRCGPNGKLVRSAYYWQGSKTASGQRFDPDGFTAAHRTLPFGTRLKVTNPRTGRSVDVVVNDRGPFTPGLQIDISRGAARAIGLSGTGTVCLL
jgi:rare lipoprotein A